MSASAWLKNPAFDCEKLLTPDSLFFLFCIHFIAVWKVYYSHSFQKAETVVNNWWGNDLIRQPAEAPSTTRWWDLYLGQVTCLYALLMVWTIKMVLFVFLCYHSCVLSGSYVDTFIDLHNKPEIKIKCLILHVSALLVIFGLLSEFYCQAGVEET